MSSIKFMMDDQNNGPFKRGARQTEHLLPQSKVFPGRRNVIILFFFSFYGVRDPNAIYRDNLEHRMCSKIYYVRASMSGYFQSYRKEARERRKRCRGRFRCLLFFSGVLANTGEEGEGRFGGRLCILARSVDLGVV